MNTDTPDVGLTDLAAKIYDAIADHWWTASAKCACGWKKPPHSVGHRHHLAELVSEVVEKVRAEDRARVAAERERANTAEAKIAAVRATIRSTHTPSASNSQIDAGIRAADRDWKMRLRAALDTPRGDA